MIYSFTQEVHAGFGRQTFNLIEIDHQEIGELSQGKGIEWLLAVHTGKVPQAKGAQFELFSLFAGRQKIEHERL